MHKSDRAAPARRASRTLLVATLALGACAGDGEGLDANGRPLPPDQGGGEEGVLTADFASIQQHVFTPICSVCHAGASAPQGLRLDAANSYLMLVGVASTEAPGILRIRPGDPDNSYLVQKIEGRAAVGAQMPPGGPPLPSATIAVIRQWIVDGAVREAAAAPSSFSVSTTTPANDEVLAASPTQILVEFTAELDAARTDAATVHLRRIDAAAEAPITAAASLANPRALIVTPLIALPPGRYELWTGGPGGAVRSAGGLDLAPNALTLTQFEVEAE